MMPKTADVQAFLHELSRRVSGEVRTDAYSRMLYSTDASIYQVEPHGVLIPRTVDDVHAATELAAKHKVAILPRTSGSSLAGQAVNQALVIDFTRHLDQILEVNKEESWVRIQPGIVLDQLNLDLAPYGLQFGPDPASSDRAALGGIVSNNSTGSHSIMYGMTADHVLEMKVILSDGSMATLGPLEAEQLLQKQKLTSFEGDIYRQLGAMFADPANQAIIQKGTPRHWRRCGGYNLDRFIPDGVSFLWPRDPRFNLAKLISGAEGTLAVITELKLNLVPKPRHTALAVIHFDDLYTALSSVPSLLEVDPSAVELLDNLGLTMCREVPQYARLLKRFVEGEPNSLLITEFNGENEADLQARLARLDDHLARHDLGQGAIVKLVDPAAQKDVWTVRKVGLGLLMSIKGDHKPIPFIEDAAVPTEHLAEYVTRIEKFCNDLGTRVAYYAHASAGCIHIRPLINTKVATDVAKLPKITQFSAELLGEYGGSMSSEHGDGRARSWVNKFFYGEDLYGLYKDVKGIMDPANILNPGNVVDGPPMTEDLRYGASYTVIPLKEHLDFSRDLGFARAVEMCNGAGICRKRTAGTMCPSFQATREEEHATRGRANALRAALSGRFPAQELTSKRMYEVMDLCVSCKACKAECPSSVDMAKIKTEFLAHYYEANGTPLRAKMFGNISLLSRLGSGPLSSLSNWAVNNGIIKTVLDKSFGISAERSLPNFAAQPFTSWFKKRGQQPAGRKGNVVLFNDTFNTYNYPQVAIAATELLEAAGYGVILAGHKCCGRPMLSKGLVKEARAMARDTVQKLAPFAAQGTPIIGLEPSCLLTIRDEYRDLLPNDDKLAQVAEHSLMLEEFLAQQQASGNLDLEFVDDSREVLLHGHCHQKSLVGTGPSHAVLGLPENYSVHEVDSGCCGMAGSFGYEAEHYDISLRMGERRLLPAVRESDAETLIVAAGVSCRQQIKHGTGRTALHPAEMLRNALVDKAP
ncbi:MAG: FAD-binding protein [Anaerolineales bacterium]|nr:FAD-binding protein [Anaerolineales bacterium]MCB0006889.1 FAD-binding protein [Anaerolineales bacterium]MCB8958798.1 FAD-binding protein [Ardenticatenales bacterium]